MKGINQSTQVQRETTIPESPSSDFSTKHNIPSQAMVVNEVQDVRLDSIEDCEVRDEDEE